MNPDNSNETRSLDVTDLSLEIVVSKLMQFKIDNPELKFRRMNINPRGDHVYGTIMLQTNDDYDQDAYW